MTTPPAGGHDGSEGAKRQDVSHAARSGSVQVLTVAAQGLLTVTQVLLARLYGRAVFGSYQATSAILELLTRGGTGGADKGMLRDVAAHRAAGETESVRGVIGTGLRLCLIISGSAALLLLIAAGPLARLMREPALETSLRIMAPAAIVTGCMWILVQASLSAKVTRPNFYVRGLGEPVLFLSAGLGAALFGRSLATLAVAHVVAATATLLLAIVVVGRVFGRGELRRSLRMPWTRGFLRFSLPLGAGDLLNAVLQRADLILLTAFVGTSAAGVYAAAEFITRVIASARSVFDSVAAPVFSEALHLGQRERLRQNLILMVRWVVSVAAPITVTVVVIRRDFLALYGAGFQEGATALVVLALSHFVNVSFGLSGWILVGAGRSPLLLKNNIVVAAVNIALGFVLIPRLGLLGTAFAQLGSVVLLHLLVLVEVRTIFGVYPFDRTILKPLTAAAVTFGLEFLLAAHLSNVAVRVPAVIVLGGACYLAVLLALGLDPEERRLAAGVGARLRALGARLRALGAQRPPKV
jgi:O-antigen/teichoic acid export membrane protein